VVSLAIGGKHLHLQLKCDPRRVIAILGDVKRKLWYERNCLGNPARLWGRGRKIIPIENKPHQVATLKYVLDHRDEGAWVWSYRDPIP
jgi:hypothetical protein